ncbi:MAG: SAM-dependent methyltransferase, partial [Cyanobacteria bacterium J06641_5]
LVDALPVHLVELVGDRLQEIYVAYRGDNFVEIRDEPSTPKLAEYFSDLGIELPGAAYPEGYRTEVNLAARTWLETVDRKLQQGYLLTIDYGYPAAKYYHPQRYQGTLQCYYQHRRHNDPYLAVGEQDLTAHVNFTDLELQGNRLGLTHLGFTRQGLFLMALGLGDRLATLAQTCKNPAELFQRRDALHQLIDPMGLGGFGVLLQGKNLTLNPAECLPRGFVEPAPY